MIMPTVAAGSQEMPDPREGGLLERRTMNGGGGTSIAREVGTVARSRYARCLMSIYAASLTAISASPPLSSPRRTFT